MMGKIAELANWLGGTNIVLEPGGVNAFNVSFVGLVVDSDYEIYKEFVALCKENGIIVNPLRVSHNAKLAIDI